MPFVIDDDVQAHLPQDKLDVDEIPDDKDLIYLGVERILRGYLAGVVDSTVLSTWTDPDLTPDPIRECAALLSAAEIYRIRFSEGAFSDPERAQVLYNQGMGILNGIIAGNIVIPSVDTTTFDSTYFAPNDASTDQPKFTMSGRF